jgi:hypothetical protein
MGLKHFGKKGYDAALGEIKQLHDCVVFKPMPVNELTQQEKKGAMESLIFWLRNVTVESKHMHVLTEALNVTI